MKAPTLTVENALANNRPFFIIFKSESCAYCHSLAPAIAALQSKYGTYLDFYFLDVDDGGNILEIFKGQISGVPSIILVFDEEYVVIPEPEHPDPHMWYTLSYLEKYIKEFLRGENA